MKIGIAKQVLKMDLEAIKIYEERNKLTETDWKEVARQAAEYFCSNK